MVNTLAHDKLTTSKTFKIFIAINYYQLSYWYVNYLFITYIFADVYLFLLSNTSQLESALCVWIIRPINISVCLWSLRLFFSALPEDLMCVHASIWYCVLCTVYMCTVYSSQYIFRCAWVSLAPTTQYWKYEQEKETLYECKYILYNKYYEHQQKF